ncbi:MAG: hypothetical protein HFG66_01255 [Hungatella sp.]|nr:hypothetical protein [Hungatella sp.]
MCERAVFLSRLEFSVLLMAEGVEEIRCFTLPGAKDVNRKEMIEAVHGLILKGFLQVEDKGISLSLELASMTECIKGSTACLFVEPGDLYQPQRIVYIGGQAAVLENADDTNSGFRLFIKEPENLWAWLEDTFDLPKTAVMSKAEAGELVRLNQLAEEELRRLQEWEYPGNAAGIRFWMEQLREGFGETPFLGIRFIRSCDGQTCKDLILLPGSANMWFLWRGREKLEVMPDSIETRKEMETLFWREAE